MELELKHRLCFSFCSDLGNKKVKDQDLDQQVNIKWSLFRVKQRYTFMGGGAMDLPNADFKVPGIYEVQKVKGDWTSSWGDKQYGVFIAPSDYGNDGRIFYKDSRTIYIDLPGEAIEYPHLHKHSTFQFYYLKNNLFSASCQYLGCENEKIKAKVGVYASPSGTYFYWESANIFFKWKVEVRQNIVVMSLVEESKEHINKIGKKIVATIIKA